VRHSGGIEVWRPREDSNLRPTPVGLSLFISSFRFREPVFNLYRASLPFAILMFLALVLITYFPFLSLWLVHLLGR